MSGYPHGISHATRTDPLRVLEDIKRQALEVLGGLPGTLYGPVEDALKLAALKADGKQNYYEEQAALWMLRQQQATHVMRFRQQIAQGFDDFRALRIRSGGELTLSLVGEQELEYSLAGERLNEALMARFSRALDGIGNGLRGLAAALRLPMGSNPIGPERLVAAFTNTLVDVQLPDALRTRLFRQYEQELLRLLGDFYARVGAQLAAAGYSAAPVVPAPLEPEPRPEPGYDGRHVAESHGTGAAGSYGAGGHGQAAAGGAPDGAAGPAPVSHEEFAAMASELAQLRSQLQAWRESTPAPRAAGAGPRALGPRRELRVDELVSVASLLQAEPPDAFARALAVSGRLAETIRDHLQDGARRLGLDPDETCFSPEEEDAIDLVALLFDSLFRHNALRDRARRVYARLVLPYVKVALTDGGGVFVRRDHPARRLLDAITEACEGNDAETPQDRELLDRAHEISQRIVAEYNEDLAVFELAHAELDALLAQQRRRIELQEQRAAKAAFGRERLDTARAQADAAVQQRLAEPELTQAVAEFLAMPWRHHLVQILLREGADTQRYADALALGDALLAADRLAAENRGRELAAHLLALQPGLVECLASSGLDGSAAEHGMAGLVRALCVPDTPRRRRPPPPPLGASEDEGGHERKLWLAGGTDTVAHDPILAERMRSLEVGDWVRLTDADGETVAAKIAWVSPLTSRFLLVNRRGIRVLVASAEELAVLAAQNRLQIGAERTAFDEAMRQVRRHLDRAATR
ncbi:DUF1631 family protein [Vulcaniibacterium tengchongense]|uniref:Uncharacterized protein DUF1631 n=1 Tax=Vulcaniibacterium tengchongense TaxID=1273429 RepID=A0A3N4UXR9_9GAMM|nr:DUF1631 family protein [Vulcaniibacterium tengchongense]RPE75512.1 uncharacterized protein DUF1631 [Vulcaniibacterium tengchongense]